MKARSKVAAHSHHGRPASAALLRILSSMSVTLRMKATSKPFAVSQRRSTSNATPLRTWPMCGRPCTVAPQR